MEQVENPLKEVRDLIWRKALVLSIELEYRKTQYKKGKYDALKEIWDELDFESLKEQTNETNR